MSVKARRKSRVAGEKKGFHRERGRTHQAKVRDLREEDAALGKCSDAEVDYRLEQVAQMGAEGWMAAKRVRTYIAEQAQRQALLTEIGDMTGSELAQANRDLAEAQAYVEHYERQLQASRLPPGQFVRVTLPENQVRQGVIVKSPDPNYHVRLVGAGQIVAASRDWLKPQKRGTSV